MASNIPGFARFRSLKCNNDGTGISFTAEGSSKNQLLIWRTAWNVVEQIDVATATENQVDGSIYSHYWDEEEPRIVLCQAHPASAGAEKSWLISFFVPADQQEILVQDVVSANGADQLLIGVRLPQYFMLDEAARVQSRVLASLASLNEHSDKSARDALLSFSCHLRRGKVEQAYQAVRTFASPKIWDSLARSCVQLKRPDVGLICLGKLGNARAAGAVRIAHTKYPGQIEAITAILAVQLGMVVREAL